ncbi:DUF2490 domain-containing protein [Rasiella sp. SM2506]|uniref:DUF2490 domain-containing protein n=1 Tax=Rasiella sp. SM2506 TaxID=3423914 RepID=UPI003D7A5761
MKYNTFIAAILLFSFTTNSLAQQDPSDELGVWYILASNSKISEKVSFQLQTQFRFYELVSEIQQFKIRTGVKYRIMEGLSAGIGYAYFRNDFSYLSEIPPSFDEHRIVEDIYLDHNVGKVKVDHRARLENRFIVNNGETDTRHWFRYMAKFTYPFSDAWSADVYNEIWLNVGDEPTFAQNWFGVGAGYKFSNFIKSRVGYQRIHLDGPDFDRLLLEITFTPDFSKKTTP